MVGLGRPGAGLRSILERRARSESSDRADTVASFILVGGVAVYAVATFVTGQADGRFAVALVLVVAGIPLSARMFRSVDVTGSVAGVAGGLAAYWWVTPWVRRLLLGDPGTALVWWPALVIAAGALPFMMRPSAARRRVTSLLAQMVVVVGGVLVGWFPPVWVGGATLGLVLVVVWLRASGLVLVGALRARAGGVSTDFASASAPVAVNLGRESKFSEQNLTRGAAAEVATGDTLSTLPLPWRVLYSRRIPGVNADIDALVLGLPGVFLVDTKDWAGSVSLGADGEVMLNGSQERMTALLRPVAHEATQVAARLALGPQGVRPVVCFDYRMDLPEPVIEVEYGGMVMVLVLRSSLLWYLTGQPDLVWRRGNAWTRMLHGDAAQARASERFVWNLAQAAAYALPPAS